MTRHVPLAPQARGRIPPRILPLLERRGFTVHRLGAATYIHRDELHLIAGSWDGSPPPWADRLGEASAGYVRRLERCDREQRSRWMLRDELGRFAIRLPWWRVPGPVVYRHERRRPSLYELSWERP